MNLINLHEITIITIIVFILILIFFNYKTITYFYSQSLILLIVIICASLLMYIHILIEIRLGIILNVDMYYSNKHLFKGLNNAYFKNIDWNFLIKQLNKNILNNKHDHIADNLFMNIERYRNIQKINNMTEEEKINYVRKLWWEIFLVDNIYYIGIGTITIGFIYFLYKNL